MTVTPDTPQTIEGVTVSAPRPDDGYCKLDMPSRTFGWYHPDAVRAMGLTVPEPTVQCRIGDQEFTLTREQVKRIGVWGSGDLSSWAAAIGAAARAHLNAEAGR